MNQEKEKHKWFGGFLILFSFILLAYSVIQGAVLTLLQVFQNIVVFILLIVTGYSVFSGTEHLLGLVLKGLIDVLKELVNVFKTHKKKKK